MSNMKKAREAAGLSQKEVAITLKVSAPTVSDWEKGKKNPMSGNLKELAKLYSVSTDYLLGLTDDWHAGSSLSIHERVAFMLQEARDNAGFTQEDVAIYLSRPQQEISDYERNVHTPDASVLLQLLAFYRVSPAKFMANCGFQLMAPMDEKKEFTTVSDSEL